MLIFECNGENLLSFYKFEDCGIDLFMEFYVDFGDLWFELILVWCFCGYIVNKIFFLFVLWVLNVG